MSALGLGLRVLGWDLGLGLRVLGWDLGSVRFHVGFRVWGMEFTVERSGPSTAATAAPDATPSTPIKAKQAISAERSVQTHKPLNPKPQTLNPKP